MVPYINSSLSFSRRRPGETPGVTGTTQRKRQACSGEGPQKAREKPPKKTVKGVRMNARRRVFKYRIPFEYLWP